MAARRSSWPPAMAMAQALALVVIQDLVLELGNYGTPALWHWLAAH